MTDGKGAAGAGTIRRWRQSAFGVSGLSVYVVVRGQRAMPPFGEMMNDAQVAAVVNYLRTHFGNHYTTR